MSKDEVKASETAAAPKKSGKGTKASEKAENGSANGVSGTADPETLSQSGPAEAMMIPFGDIHVNDDLNVRKTYDKKRLESLAAAIKLQGQLDPFLIGPKDEKTGKHSLIAGFRRARAHKMIHGDKADKVLVPVNLKPFKTTDEALLANMSFDEGREPVKRYELADRLHYMASSLGYKGVDLAKRINMSNATVSNLISCRTKLAPEVLEAWKKAPSPEQEIPISRLVEWAQYSHEDQIAALADYMASDEEADEEESEGKSKKGKKDKAILMKPLGKKVIVNKLEDLQEREAGGESLSKEELGALKALRWVLQVTKTLRFG